MLILDNIRSLHNVGSIFRTADAFNIEKILLCGITATPPHREIHRSALGAEESVSWEYHKSTLEAASRLKEKGYELIAIEQTTNSIPLNELRPSPIPHPPSHNALIFGNEINGVSQEVLDICDLAIEIPQLGTKHSFNVSVTAGIVLWELCTSPIAHPTSHIAHRTTQSKKNT